MPAPEQVIEDLVVRLTGDGTEYQKMLRQIETSTVQTAHRVEEATQKIESFQGGMRGFAQAVIEVAALAGAYSLLREAVDNFAEAELVGLKLTATLKSNRREVEKTRKEYDKFAADMEEFTVVAGTSVLKMLTMAEAFDLTSDKATKAVKDAISLSGILEGAPEQYIRLTAALAKGDTEAAMRYARMIPQLRGVKDETEFLAKANQLLATGWKTAQAEAGSFSGTVKRLRRDWGNMTEEFGKIVSAWVKPALEQMRKLVIAVKESGEEFKRVLVVVLTIAAGLVSLGPILKVVSPVWRAMLGPMTLITGVLGKLLGSIMHLMHVSVLLGLVWKTFTGILGGILFIINPLKMIGLLLRIIMIPLAIFMSPHFTIIKWTLSFAAAIVAWVRQVGGIQNAWDILVEKSKKLWQELQPIFKALQSIFQFIAGVAVEAIFSLGDHTLEMLEDLMHKINIDWIAVRDGIVSGIQLAEMALRGFGDVASLVFEGIKTLVAPLIGMIKKMFAGDGSNQGGTKLGMLAANVNTASKAIGDFMSRNRNWITFLSGGVVTVLLVIGAIKLLSLALGLLKIKWIITTAATATAAVVNTGVTATQYALATATMVLGKALGALSIVWKIIQVEAMIFRGTVIVLAAILTPLILALKAVTAAIFSKTTALILWRTAVILGRTAVLGYHAAILLVRASIIAVRYYILLLGASVRLLTGTIWLAKVAIVALYGALGTLVTVLRTIKFSGALTRAIIAGISAVMRGLMVVVGALRAAWVALNVTTILTAAAFGLLRGAVIITQTLFKGLIATATLLKAAWISLNVVANLQIAALATLRAAWFLLRTAYIVTQAVVIGFIAVIRSNIIILGLFRVALVANTIAIAVLRGAIFAATIVMAGLRIVILAVWTAMTLANLKTVAWIAALTVWYTIVVLAKVAAFLFHAVIWLVNVAITAFNATIGFSNVLVAIGKLLWYGYSAGALVAKAAVWLLNAALTVTNFLLGSGVVIAAVATLGALVIVFIVMGSVVYGAYSAVKQLFSSLADLANNDFGGSFRKVGKVFGEWIPVIKAIIDGVAHDMPKSWELLKAQVKVTILQLMQLWTPFFNFLKESFIAIADLMGATFEVKFYQAIGNVSAELLKFLDFFKMKTLAFQTFINDLNKNAVVAVKGAAKVAEGSLSRAAKKLAKATENIVDTDAIKAAKKERDKALEDLEASRPSLFKRLAQDLLDQKKIQQDAEEEAEKHGQKMGDAMANPIKKATAEVSRFDAALINSAEAITRVAEYRDRLETSLINQEIDRQEALTKRRGGRQHEQVGGRFDANQRGGAEGNVRGAEQEALLRDIRNILRDQAKRPGPVLRPAGI